MPFDVKIPAAIERRLKGQYLKNPYHNFQFVSKGIENYIEATGHYPSRVDAIAWYYYCLRIGLTTGRAIENSVKWLLRDIKPLGLSDGEADEVIKSIRSLESPQSKSVVTDIALSMNGGEFKDHQESMLNLWREYKVLSLEAFTIGRIQTIASIFERPNTFFSVKFQDRFEAEVNENLTSEMAEALSNDLIFSSIEHGEDREVRTSCN